MFFWLIFGKISCLRFLTTFGIWPFGQVKDACPKFYIYAKVKQRRRKIYIRPKEYEKSADCFCRSGFLAGDRADDYDNGSEVMSGGVARGSIIYNQQDVMSGGTAYDTYVYASAVQNISGTAYNSTVISRGTIDVDAGGIAYNTAVNGGLLNVSAGGSVENTVLKQGRENIYGEDIGARVSGGIQQVMSGGVSTGAQISGGRQIVDAGGRVEQSVLSSDGWQQVSGTIVNATVLRGGILDILNSGEAEGVHLEGGDMYVSADASSQNTIMTSGTMDIYGEDSGSTVSGGIQNIRSGGRATGTTVSSGGVQRVYDGAVAADTTVRRAGLLALYSGGTLAGQTNLQDAILTVVGSNSIGSLISDNSLIRIARMADGFRELQINELTGNGTFSLSSNLAAGESDTINVQDVTGSFGLIIHDYSADGTLPQSFKIINEDTTTTDNFYLVGDAVDVGAFQYSLQHRGEDWLLVRTQQVSDSSIIAKNTYTSLVSLFYTQLTPIYNRLRIKRDPDRKDNGLWIKGFGRRIDFDYDDDSDSKTDVFGTELGYDYEIWNEQGYRILLGAYGGVGRARQTYDRSGRGDGTTKSFGLYTSLRTENKWFADVIGTYFWHDQKVRSYTPSGSAVEGSYDTDAWQTSMFVGKRWNFADNWFVEPAAGISYMHLNGTKYRTNFNTLIEAEDTDFANLSLNLAFGKGWALDNGALIDVYGKTGIIHDWNGEGRVRVADYAFAEDITSTRYEIGGGISASLNKDSLAYIDVSTQFGDKVSFPWEMTFGLQLMF